MWDLGLAFSGQSTCPCADPPPCPPEASLVLSLIASCESQMFCRWFDEMLSARAHNKGLMCGCPLSVWLQFPHGAQCSGPPPSQSNQDLPELWGLRTPARRRDLYTTTEHPERRKLQQQICHGLYVLAVLLNCKGKRNHWEQTEAEPWGILGETTMSNMDELAF